MGTAKHSTRLAAAMAIILGTASSTDAEAQSRLNVYSDDFSGGSRAAPTGASRDTVINMQIPRLHALHRRLLAVQTTLRTHRHASRTGTRRIRTRLLPCPRATTTARTPTTKTPTTRTQTAVRGHRRPGHRRWRTPAVEDADDSPPGDQPPRHPRRHRRFWNFKHRRT